MEYYLAFTRRSVGSGEDKNIRTIPRQQDNACMFVLSMHVYRAPNHSVKDTINHQKTRINTCLLCATHQNQTLFIFQKAKKLKSARDSMTCTPPDIACMALCTPRYRRVSVTTPEATAVGLAVHVSGNIHVGHSSSKKRPNGSTARMVVRDHGSHFEWSTCADALRACFALSPSFGSVSANCMFLGGPKRRLCVRIRTNAIMIGGVKTCTLHAESRDPTSKSNLGEPTRVGDSFLVLFPQLLSSRPRRKASVPCACNMLRRAWSARGWFDWPV